MEIEKIENALIIHLKEDRLMEHLASDFCASIAEIVDKGHNNIILNLRQVRYLDSSGMGAMMSIRKMLGSNGTLLLCGLTEHVEKSFRLSRMDAVFDIFEDTADALAA